MDPIRSVVVVGAGLAGARSAETLRAGGFHGPIRIVGAESHLPYERPALSKEYLQGRKERDSVLVHPAAWYEQQGVEVLAGRRVTRVDPGDQVVGLDDGRQLAWDAILIATGSRPRRLGVPGEDLAGVLHLRTLDDSDRLRQTLESVQRLVVVGAGWIGLEAAAAAREAGVAVTILERAELPLVAVLGPEVAAVFADLHREHDVDLRLGVEVASLVGSAGAVTGVALGDGQVVPADAVLVAVGATPRTELAADAGLDVDSGILVDAALRASSPGVWAAGDVAEAFHPLLGRRIRVEHWDNAREQGVAAARSILGEDVAYERLPYFYTDQYDLGMEYTGHVVPGGHDQVILRGDVPGREFVALWLSHGRVLAGMGVNIWDAMDPVRDLVNSRRVVDVKRAQDPTIPLAEL